MAKVWFLILLTSSCSVQRASTFVCSRIFRSCHSCARLSQPLNNCRSLRRIWDERSLAALRSEQQQPEDSVTGSSSPISERRFAGIAVLLTVPLVWGTYNPVIKYMYTLNPPVPGLVFSAAYYILAAVTLWSLFALFSDDEADPDNVSWRGGAELGTYLFLGNLVQVLALKSIPADRAGFLVQLTTIIVPFMDAFVTGREIPLRTWGACWIAMLGVLVIQGESLLSLGGGLGIGDSMILLAAVFYSLHVVRLGRLAPKTTPLRLAACKATVEATLSVGLIGGLLAISGSGLGPAQEIQSFADDVIANGIQTESWAQVVGAVLWTGWATCAYTIYAQSYGQSRVTPTDANLIYTAQPLFTAMFAFALLGETIGATEIAGGTLIASSVLVVASANDIEKA